MLNHLDDPDGQELPPDFAADVRRRGRRLRRRRWLTAGAAVVLLAIVGAGAGLYARALDRMGDVDRITVAGTRDSPDPGDRTILIVGSDGADPDGTDYPGHSDTILLVRLRDDAARVLSIPRDLVVDPDGDADLVRINTVSTSHGYGGLVEVIEAEFSIGIDNFIRVDMDGFADLVDLVGGIDVDFDHPTRDSRSGLDVTEPGCERLDGAQALALARSRHVQVLVDGRWTIDPTGDLGRIDRQSVVVGAGLQALTRARPDPLTADRLASWLVGHATVDASIDDRLLVSIAATVMSLSPGDLTFTTVAVESYLLPGGAAVLRAAESAEETRDRWNDGAEGGPVDGVDPGTSNDVAESISLC